MPRSRILAILVLVAVVAAGVAIFSHFVGDDVSEHRADTLRIEVRTDASAAAKVMTLQCDPLGGNHPDGAAACAALDKAGLTAFDATPKDQACTMIYGGPQTAKVTGTYKNVKVNSTFTRSNGCEIDRWDSLGTAFFDVPMQ